jgi:hypothetical protein
MEVFVRDVKCFPNPTRAMRERTNARQSQPIQPLTAHLACSKDGRELLLLPGKSSTIQAEPA